MKPPLTAEQLQKQRLRQWKGQFKRAGDNYHWVAWGMPKGYRKKQRAKTFQVRGSLLAKIRQLEPEFYQ